jgi:hypothetical protein
MISKLAYLIITFAVSAIPLNIAVSLMDGKSSWIKAILANIIVAVLSYFAGLFFGKYAGILSLVLLLMVYKILFDLGWFRSLVAWLIQLVIIAFFWVVVGWLGVKLF